MPVESSDSFIFVYVVAKGRGKISGALQWGTELGSAANSFPYGRTLTAQR